MADRERAIVGGRNIGNDYFDLSTHYNFLDSDLLIDGSVAASIADSFDLYWASDWVTDPGVLGQAAKALTDDRLLGPLDAQETALMATLRGHRSALPPSTCADLQFVTDYPGSGVERRRVYPTIARLVHKLAQSPELPQDAGRGLLDVVTRYARTFLLLQRYDEGLLTDPPQQSGGRLPTVDEARGALGQLKADLIERGEATDLFARERGDGLPALLGNLDQSVFGEPAYPSVEAKAAHLLGGINNQVQHPTGKVPRWASTTNNSRLKNERRS